MFVFVRPAAAVVTDCCQYEVQNVARMLCAMSDAAYITVITCSLCLQHVFIHTQKCFAYRSEGKGSGCV